MMVKSLSLSVESSSYEAEESKTPLLSEQCDREEHVLHDLEEGYSRGTSSIAKPGDKRDGSVAAKTSPVISLSSTTTNNVDDSSSDPEGVDTSSGEMLPSLSGILRVIKLARSQLFYLILGFVSLLIRLPFSLCIPHFVGSTLGALGRADYETAKKNIILMICMGSIDAVMDYWCNILQGLANLNIVKTLRVDTFNAILRKDSNFFHANDVGELASRLSSDCGAIVGDLTGFLRNSIESIIRITWIIVYMFLRSPTLAGCSISAVPIIAIATKKVADWLRQNALDIQNAIAYSNAVSLEALSGARESSTVPSQEYQKDRYSKSIQHLYDLSLKQMYWQMLYNMIINMFLICTCVQALLLWIGMILIRKNSFDVEVLLAFMLYQGQLQGQVMGLFNSFTILMKSSGAGQKVFSIFDNSPD